MQTREDVIKAVERDGRPSGDVIRRLHELQAADTKRRLEKLSRHYTSRFGDQRTLFQESGIASLKKYRHTPSAPVPFDLPGLMCPPGYTELGSASSNFYGKDEAPRFGPLVDPQPSVNSFPQYPFHIYSAQTHGAVGEMSLAVAAANDAAGGYGVTNPIPNSGGNGTTSASTGLTTSFYLPGINKKMSALQAAAQLMADHSIVESITAIENLVAPKNAVLWVGVYGIFTVTLTQGLGFLFGDYTRFSSSTPFIIYNNVNGAEYIQSSPIDSDGAINAYVSAKYDGLSDIFFVSTDISIQCLVLSDGPSFPCAIACDTRFAEDPIDDQLRIYNDDALYSCGYQVTQMKLCGA